MARRFPLGALGVSALIVQCLLATAVSAAPPQLISAVSRMKHGTAGTFDVQLPLSGASGIECRTLARGLTLVLTFNEHIVSGKAAVTSGIATIDGKPYFAGHQVYIQLRNVHDAQSLTINVSNMANPVGAMLKSADVHLRVLQGDVNGSGSLTAADVSICKTAVTQGNVVNGANFRCDINADGLITSSDLNLVKTQVATSAAVTGGPAASSPPTISSIPNQAAISGQPMSPVGFTVGKLA